MNLKFHLLLQIALVAIFCLMATAAYVLYQADRQVKQESQMTAESIGKQLEVQLWRIDAGYGSPSYFPDLDLWKQTHAISGICVRFISKNNEFTHSICHGSELPNKRWPNAFEKMYRWVFNPGFEVSRPITFNGRGYGSINVIPNTEMELARAWDSVVGLLGLSASTVVAVCLLVYITIYSENITRINRHIMETMRTLLVRLRPAELDELGLEACLNTLIVEWNRLSGGQIHYQLIIKGDCYELTEPLPITLFRIVQEGLTNSAKHSTATNVLATLEISEQIVVLTIEDNGNVDALPFGENQGIGLLGIRERVTGLGGQLKLEIGQPSGLIVRVELPNQAVSETQA